ncbi:MAG: hypothetical protein PUK70_00990 [Bacteroidales bacterium]|nr:hypothetical protein [Bacteroidales bacterium]MDY6001551.1 hypothetical protein [Candidatus Cryptobacteroides sp.]
MNVGAQDASSTQAQSLFLQDRLGTVSAVWLIKSLVGGKQLMIS